MPRIVLNFPPIWLSKALGFISSETPNELDTLISPVLETMQGGLALGFHEVQLVPGSLAGAVITDIPAVEDPDHAYLVRWSSNNVGTANSLCVAQLIAPTTGFGPVLYIGNVPPATTFGWYTATPAGFGGGGQFIYVPPGWRLRVSQAQYTTTAGNQQFHSIRVPAGTRPW